MSLRSYRPGAPLSDFIENLWIYEGVYSPHLKERIFPSGTFELVINLRKDELRIHDDAGSCRHLSGAVVSGPYEASFLADTADETCVMGVHFRPGGALPFLGISADELAGTHVNLTDLWGGAGNELHERLYAAPGPAVRFRVLARALLSRLRPAPRHPAVSLALDGFRRDRSRAAVRNLARLAGLSERRLIDVFKFEVGLKPKLFNRVLRFQRVLAQVDLTGMPDWSELALRYGYFDQSHLIRDFLAFSGCTPGEYVRRQAELRKHGMQIKFNHLPLVSS